MRQDFVHAGGLTHRKFSFLIASMRKGGGSGEAVTLSVRRQELSSLEKFPRPDRGLGGVRIEDSFNRWARRCR